MSVLKKRILTLIGVFMVLVLTACGTNDTTANEQAGSGTNGADIGENHILVAYFSKSGNTESMAQVIQEQTGGDLFEIVPQEPYPDSYDETVERHLREREEDARPEIASAVENMDEYNIVFVGYPIWSSDMPHIVQTFLEQYDFSGKTIIPFCTHGGSRFGNSIATLEGLCPDAALQEGFEVSGGSAESHADEIAQWLESLGL